MRSLLLLPLLLVASLFGLLPDPVLAQQVQPVPALSAHVTDPIGLLSVDKRKAIEVRLATLERDKGAQVAVLLIATTQPEAIEEYSIRVAEAWRLGRKGVDDGVLFVVARDDRQMRIEVGRGLEGAIPDAIAKRIIADLVTPHFRKGDFPLGIEAGVEAIAARVSGEPLPAPPQKDKAAFAGLSDVLEPGIVLTLAAGGILRALFGRLVGATCTGVVVGLGAWMLTGAFGIGLVCAVLAFVFTLVIGFGSRARHVGGAWGGGSGGGGWSGGGGGWSGGGGGFGGGGASGRW